MLQFTRGSTAKAAEGDRATESGHAPAPKKNQTSDTEKEAGRPRLIIIIINLYLRQFIL